MDMGAWKKFPYDNTRFNYVDDDLRQAWDQLHAGDCAAFPRQERLQQAWRCFHRGDFYQAVKLADQCGISGHAVANKATGIYATYLENEEDQQIKCFKAAIKRAEHAIAHVEYGNGLYLLYGENRLEDITDLYNKAAEMVPHDAMEKLDVESALAELE